MDPILSAGLLILIGIFAGFMNVMAGGGSTLTLPALIFLGLDPITANGTNRVAILLQNVAAISSFRQEKYSAIGNSLKMSLLTLPGGVLGAILAVKLDGEVFKMILGIVMIAIVVSMIIPRKKVKEINHEPDKITPAAYLSMFFIGFYGGFIQVGVGFIIMASLKYILKLDLVRINMHKVFIVFVYTLPAFIVFMVSGRVDYFLGLSLAVGNSLGGWWAAKITVRKGEKVIKAVLIIAILFSSIKLFEII